MLECLIHIVDNVYR